MELDHALAEGDPLLIRQELSDILLHLAFQLVIAEERGEFGAAAVADDLETKMRRRHPHLFQLGPAEPWERIKRRERRGRTLHGLVPTLPSLLMAFRLQERAASVGFDWPDVEGPVAKIREELGEVEEELAQRVPVAASAADPNAPGPAPSERLVDELGDLLFAVVNLARKAGVQPGPALDRANQKFAARFEAMEHLADVRGIDVGTAGLEQLDALWNEIKAG
jgi:nucleoside triphosphate diphosphatase